MALPEKELYRLDECAKRWACVVEDIVDYLEMGLLVPAIHHGPISVEVWEGMTGLPNPDTGLPEDGECTGRVFLTKGWAYLPYFPLHQAHGVGESTYLRLSECALSGPDGTGRLFLLANGEPDADIPLAKLRIPRREVAAFDAYLQTHSKPMGTKERDNLLRMVALLARLLITSTSGHPLSHQKASPVPKKGVLGSINEPNVLQIAQKLLDHMEEFDIATSGLSNSSIRERLTKAFELLAQESSPAAGAAPGKKS